MYRVFISSTFLDLATYRESVANGIRRLGAVDISMENLGARDERPKEECVRLIREGSDLFVGIYAHRYGFVPDGDEQSITEAEYRAAATARLPCLIYLVDEETPWLPRLVDQGEPAKQLDRLKKHLRATHVCGSFTNPDHLRGSVCADLGREIIKRDLVKVGASDPAGEVRGGSRTADEWELHREGLKERHRGVFLAHALTASRTPGQRFDISIYLVRQRSTDFTDVAYAEFYLGRHWGKRVFRVQNDNEGRIGILVSAYGTFLCTCRITFQDGVEVETSRYIDFESAPG